MGAGPVQATSLIVVGMIGIFMLIEKFMRPEGLIGHVGVADPSWNGTRRDVKSCRGLVGGAAGKIVVKQRLVSITDRSVGSYRLPGSDPTLLSGSL